MEMNARNPFTLRSIPFLQLDYIKSFRAQNHLSAQDVIIILNINFLSGQNIVVLFVGEDVFFFRGLTFLLGVRC